MSDTGPVAIPDYSWTGRAASTIPELVDVALALDEPEIPELFADPTGEALPRVDPTAGRGQLVEPLVEISPPVATLSVYARSGWPYAVQSALLRRGVADQLATAAGWLPDGFGLVVWDAWRDPRLQAELYRVAYQDLTLEPGFVNPPEVDPATPPPHATGGTVDLTLSWAGLPLHLGTAFDAFIPAARTTFFESAAASGSEGLAVRNLRRLLRRVMTDAGFVQLDCEWWHFEYGTRLWAAVHGRRPLFGAIAPEAEVA